MKKEVLFVGVTITSVLWLLICCNQIHFSVEDGLVEKNYGNVIVHEYYTAADLEYEEGEVSSIDDPDEESDKSVSEESEKNPDETEIVDLENESDESSQGETKEDSSESSDEEISDNSEGETEETEKEETEEVDETDETDETEEGLTDVSDEVLDEENDLTDTSEIEGEELELLEESLILGGLKDGLSFDKDLISSFTDEAGIQATSYNKVYNTAVEMAKSKNLQKGYLVRVKGYYSDGDGGKADYTISDVAGDASIKLANGLYANLVLTESINIRQLGAVGDGKADDSKCLQKALDLATSKVIIPEGTFDLCCKEIRIPHNISIEGSGQNKSTLLNLNFRAHYGLKIRDLTCKGAFLRDIWNTSEATTARTMFWVTPKGAQDIEYINCTFTDADYVSWAICKNEGYFENDVVTGCTFSNIGRCAVYHGVNTNNSRYTGNTFKNIGSKTQKTGPVAAIWVGDIANVNYTQAKNIEISDNTFENLITGDEFDESVRHVINGNFIAIRADVAVISGNVIKNLKGYGNDREAVYTKVRDLTIRGNYIKNGGSGEGYICNKGQDGNSKTLIINNTIEGDYGCGIRTYGTAKIFDNTITIKHCIAGIYATQRDGQSDDWPMEVVRNTVNGGAGEPYTIGSHTISNYNSGGLIKIIRPINVCKVMENTINPTSDYTAYLSVANANCSVYVMKNILNIAGQKGNPICIYDQKSTPVPSKQVITVSYNTFNCDAGTKNVVVKLESSNTTRKITYSNNVFNVCTDGSKSYALSCSSSTATKDSLTASGNSSNVSNKKMYVATNVKQVTYSDDEFAKLIQN